MQNVFDIREFGAVGDGVADDTEAIRAAAAEAGKCRGVIAVPPGRYVTGRIKLERGVRLEGRSGWSFTSFGTSEFILRDASEGCMLDITGAFGVAISGMSLNGRDLGENVHGIYLHWDKYNGGEEEDTPSIDDCRIGNFSGDAIHLSHGWCFSVRHNMLCYNSGAGLFIDGWDGFILDNWFSANKKGGLRSTPYASSLTLTGNRIECNDIAGIISACSDCWNITGNYFDCTYGVAMRMTNGNNLAVSGNVFYRSGVGQKDDDSSHMLLEKCRNLSITGNTFVGGKDEDYHDHSRCPQNGIIIRASEECIISSNAMHRGATETLIDIADDCKNIVTTGNIGSASKE
ncbi:MAG: hypothetical protein E7662_03855 [Ruminococcaceae bacterium]|nr:hypothetical protein [Oscillospiraceae bacterium]